MNKLDNELKELYTKILKKENFKTDRTNTNTKSIFGHQMRFDMNDGFPLTTLRKIHTKSLIHELLWFLSSYEDKYKMFGNTNIRYLVENGVNFWTDWVYDEYKKQKFEKWQSNDLKNSTTVKKFNYLSMKDFTKKIIKDDDFALKFGDLGRVYGAQWMDFGGHKQLIQETNEYKETKGDQVILDKLGWKEVYIKGINQINNVIDLLLENPDSRRMIVNAWKVDELDDMLLPPCHLFFQFYTKILTMDERILNCKNNVSEKDITKYMKVHYINNWEEIERDPRKQITILDHFNIPERKLSLQFYMRSSDTGLGLPYNIASYALLLHMIAQVVNMEPFELIYTGGDVHIYANHLKQIEKMVGREPRKLPKLKINKDIQNIYGFRFEDFEFEDYDPHENLKMDVAV